MGSLSGCGVHFGAKALAGVPTAVYNSGTRDEKAPGDSPGPEAGTNSDMTSPATKTVPRPSELGNCAMLIGVL